MSHPVRPEVWCWGQGGHWGACRGAQQGATPRLAPACLPHPAAALWVSRQGAVSHPHVTRGAVLGSGWPPECAQRGSAGGCTRASTCTPASFICGPWWPPLARLNHCYLLVLCIGIDGLLSNTIGSRILLKIHILQRSDRDIWWRNAHLSKWEVFQGNAPPRYGQTLHQHLLLRSMIN